MLLAGKKGSHLTPTLLFRIRSYWMKNHVLKKNFNSLGSIFCGFSYSSMTKTKGMVIAISISIGRWRHANFIM
jgi:hypothetical protein